MNSIKTGAVLSALLVSGSLFGTANAVAATVTYQYEEWDTANNVSTGAILGFLEFNSPPASADSGWQILTGSESDIVSFTFNGDSIDLTSSAITGTIDSVDGSQLDAGAFNTSLTTPKWALTFGIMPGVDIVNFTPFGGAAEIYEGHWVQTVPVPGAVWLFGSGLLGLIGFARRKKM